MNNKVNIALKKAKMAAPKLKPCGLETGDGTIKFLVSSTASGAWTADVAVVEIEKKEKEIDCVVEAPSLAGTRFVVMILHLHEYFHSW